MAPAFHAALRLHLIETSPRLRAVQAERLPDATWHDGLESLPDGPLVLLANEFLDALPIRQFVRRGERWMERFVAEGRFVECRSRRNLPYAGEGVLPSAAEGIGCRASSNSTNPRAIAALARRRLAAAPGRGAVPGLRPGTQRRR